MLRYPKRRTTDDCGYQPLYPAISIDFNENVFELFDRNSSKRPIDKYLSEARIEPPIIILRYSKHHK